MTVNFAGHLYNDAGTAISGASVKLLETGTTTQEGSTVTTDSAGAWAFTEADQDRYDVEITSGSSVRRIRWDDQISLKELDVRNNTGATTPAATFTNIQDAVANQVAVFSGANATRADGDEIYLSFKLANSAGDIEEFARITAEAVDVTDGSEDGQLRFGVAVANGTITDVFTINSSTGGAATISYEVDSFTIKGGEGEAGVLYLFADQGDDAGDEWKVNVADGGVLTIGNDIASAGTYVTFLTLTPHATTASSTVAIVGDATVGDDLSLTSDSSVFNMGAGNDFTITHDGTTGATLAGTPITVNSTGALTLDSSTDITLDADGADVFLKDGGTLFGTLTNSSGELVIKSSSSGTTAATFSGANVTLAGTVGSGAITSTGTIQGTTITATTAFVPDASDGAALGTTSLEFSDLYLADEAVIGFGDDQEVTLTHVHNAGLLLSSTDKLQFGDSGTFIHQSSDGVLTIESDTTVDINGAVAFDGALTGITNITLSGTLSDGNYTFDTSGNVSGLGTIGSGAITSSGNITSGGSFIIGSASIIESELEMIDGITAGTAAASKAVVLDGSKNIATIGTIGSGAITSTGTSSFATGTTIGNITLADGSITDSSGALDFGNETLTTSGVITAGGFTIGSAVIIEAELEILDGAAVTTTELNLIDGDTVRGTTALASGDGILINDGGTMRMTNVDTVQTFMGGHYKVYGGTFKSDTTGDISISSIGFVPTAAILMYGMSNTNEADAEGNWSLGWAYKTGATSSGYGMSYNYFQQSGVDAYDFDQTASYIGRLAYGAAAFSMLTITAWDADALTLTKSIASTPTEQNVDYQLLVQG